MLVENKEGFTLIEILGIILVVSIIGIIVFVAIDKTITKGKDKAFDSQVQMIELAAKNWLVDHSNVLGENEHSIEIELKTLKMGGYLSLKIADPTTGKCFNNENKIKITKLQYDKHKYEIDVDGLKNNQMNCDRVDEIFIPDEEEETPLNLPKPTLTITNSTDKLRKTEKRIILLTYNYPNLDTSKITFHEEIQDAEPVTSESFMKLGKEKYNESQKIYELEVEVTAGYAQNSMIWIDVEEGALKNSENNVNEFVSGPKISVDNTYFFEVANYSVEKKIEKGFGSMNLEDPVCMNHDVSEITSIWNKDSSMVGSYNYNTVAYAKINIDVINDGYVYYRVYRYINDIEKEYLTADETSDWVSATMDEDVFWKYHIEYRATSNGTYYVDVYNNDGTDNFETLYFDVKYNDCKPPSIVNADKTVVSFSESNPFCDVDGNCTSDKDTIKEKLKIKNLFVDEKSISKVYDNISINDNSAVNILGYSFNVEPYLYNNIYNLYDDNYKLYDTDVIYTEELRSSIAKNKLLATNEDGSLDDISELTLEEFINLKSLEIYKSNTCKGDSLHLYLNIVAMDYAGNISVLTKQFAQKDCGITIPPEDYTIPWEDAFTGETTSSGCDSPETCYEKYNKNKGEAHLNCATQECMDEYNKNAYNIAEKFCEYTRCDSLTCNQSICIISNHHAYDGEISNNYEKWYGATLSED